MYGIVGYLGNLATAISRVCINTWFDPYVYKPRF